MQEYVLIEPSNEWIVLLGDRNLDAIARHVNGKLKIILNAAVKYISSCSFKHAY